MTFLNFIKLSGKMLPFFLFALFILNVPAICGQETPQGKPKVKTSPTPAPSPGPEIFIPPGIPNPSNSTPPPNSSTPKLNPMPPKAVILGPLKKPEDKTVVRNEKDTPAEKSIATDSKVNISLCVVKGNIKINGWGRDEVRAFVSGGSQVGFRIIEKSEKNSQPVWIKVLGYDPVQNKEMKPEECLSGDEIEIDVPRNASINIESRESRTMIESVRKASVKNVSGNIFLQDISEGIKALTYEGDVVVENSSGAMNLESSSGNIVAFDVSPSEIGDIFRAKTNNGAITLQKIQHRQMDVNSISGSIRFTGEFLSDGQYSFGTQSGSILMTIPAESSLKINAVYSFGSFSSELPMANVVKQAQSLTGQIGKGEATLNQKTYSGVIRIRKL